MNADSEGQTRDEREQKELDIRWDEAVDTKARASEAAASDSRIEWDGKQWDWDSVMFLAQPLSETSQKSSLGGAALSERDTGESVPEKSALGSQMIQETTPKMEAYSQEKTTRLGASTEARLNISSKIEKGTLESSALPTSSLGFSDSRNTDAEKHGEPMDSKLGEAGKAKRQKTEPEERSLAGSSGAPNPASASATTTTSVTASFQTAPGCQVEGCKSDLSNSKEYHKRHKVCEVHSKASAVMVAGKIQRFCQQCSRFHLLNEFDEGKRSCRRRLLGHNKRRRKTVPITDRVVTTHPSMTVSHLMHSTTSDNLSLGSKPNLGMESGNFQQRIMSIITQGNSPQDVRDANFGFVTDPRNQSRFDSRAKQLTDSMVFPRMNPTAIPTSNQSSPNVDSLFSALKRSGSATYSSVLQSSQLLTQPGTNPGDRTGGQGTFVQRLLQDVSSDPGLSAGAGTVIQQTGSPPVPGMPGLINRGIIPLDASQQVHSPQPHPQAQQGVQIRPLLNVPSLMSEGSATIPNSVTSTPSRTAQLLFPISIASQTEDGSSTEASGAGSSVPSDQNSALLFSNLAPEYDTRALLSALQTRQQQPSSQNQISVPNQPPSQIQAEVNRFLDVMPMSTHQSNSQNQDHVPSHEQQNNQSQEHSDSIQAIQMQEGSESNSERPGNISFKLFDRNPGDFPITLRQQILEWLSHRPQDMESYIRPGCVILTVHLSMPESSWAWITSNFSLSLIRLMRGKGGEFWQKGKIIVQVQRSVAVIIEGIIKDITLLRAMDTPYIKSIRPLAVIAGKETRMVAKGFNLCYPATLLVSIDGRCNIKNLNNHAENDENFGNSSNVRDSKFISLSTVPSEEDGLSNGGVCVDRNRQTERDKLYREHEIEFFVNPNRGYGRCFVEASNGDVCSNSCCVLVVDEDMCRELRTLEAEASNAGDEAVIDAFSLGHSIDEIKRVRNLAEAEAETEVLNFINEFGSALYNIEIQKKRPNSLLPPYDAIRMKNLMEFAKKRGWVYVSHWLSQNCTFPMPNMPMSYDPTLGCSNIASTHLHSRPELLYDYKLTTSS